MSLSKRLSFDYPILGSPKDLPPNILPSYEDVLRCCQQERLNLSTQSNNTKVSFSTVSITVAKQIKSIYVKASIPSVTEYRIVQLIKTYHDKYFSLKKSYNRDIEKDSFKQKINDFKAKAKHIFDVAACKCPISLDCTCSKSPDFCSCSLSINCKCDKNNKIPPLELRFMYLQRNHRLGKIGSVDTKETKKMTNRLKRKIVQLKTNQTDPLPSTSTTNETNLTSSSGTNSEDSQESEEYQPARIDTTSNWQMRINLKSTAIMSDRYNVSDRATAAIASSVLKDVGRIKQDDSHLIIDRSKIRRGKKQERSNLQLFETQDMPGLYFDGRKDDTSYIEEIHGKRFRKTKKEEHYVIVKEPGSQYVSHVSPQSGASKDIAYSILSQLKSKNVDLTTLEVIGSDGTVVNTGWKNRVIHKIEIDVQRPLQWSICLLHFNELPFRHVFQKLDGITTGPSSFSGPIGKKLSSCENLLVVSFEKIEIEIPETDRNVLSKDQQYLYDISKAIGSGDCPEDLSVRNPGPLSHSRWLTTANRVLRLYIGTSSPTEQLKELVSFILKSYMPLWFQIKNHCKFTDGPKHVFQSIKTTRYLNPELLDIINPVIERNAFFAHPENLLLAMTYDERRHIRELALRRIINARRRPTKGKAVRNFIPLKINFEASEYSDIIDWSSTKVTSPPLLRKVTNTEIEDLIKSGEKPGWNVDVFPCHTQAVERCVKLVTEASQRVCGEDSRDGFIRTTILSRQQLPKFETKSDFPGTSQS